MKTKRSVLSMIIVLSVFCLSIIFDINNPFYNSNGDYFNSELFLDSESPVLVMEAQAFRIQAFTNERTMLTSYELDKTEEEGTLSEPTINIQSPKIMAANEQIDVKSAKDEPIDAETKLSSLDEVSQKEVKAVYSDIGISIAKSFVNIREKASTEGVVLGKLYKDSAAKILDTIDDWYYVVSGSVKGYVKCEYIKTGIPDDILMEKYGSLRIIVMVDGLNVRKDADTESDKLTVIYMNETYPVIELVEDWIKVAIIDDNEVGYVKRDFVELAVDFTDAVSKEEEQRILKQKEEERLKKETEIKLRAEVNYSDDDLKLLSCLVHSEAGNQSYEGKLAVANIVLNRVKSSKYANTIKGVIYQPGQFTVAFSGSLDKQLSKYENYSSSSQLLTIKAARAALEGANNVGSRLYFHSYKLAVSKGYDDKQNCVKLDDHLFW